MRCTAEAKTDVIHAVVHGLGARKHTVADAAALLLSDPGCSLFDRRSTCSQATASPLLFSLLLFGIFFSDYSSKMVSALCLVIRRCVNNYVSASIQSQLAASAVHGMDTIGMYVVLP